MTTALQIERDGGVARGDYSVIWVLLTTTDRVNDPLVSAFDHAVESCSGAWNTATGLRSQLVARVEGEVMLAALARKVGKIEITGEAKQLYNNTLRGLESLPIRMSAA